jgi:hypothetical protein
MVGAVSNLLLKHPGIWRGAELWWRDDCEVWFTDDEVTQLEEAITASDGQPVDALGKEDLLLGELARDLCGCVDCRWTGFRKINYGGSSGPWRFTSARRFRKVRRASEFSAWLMLGMQQKTHEPVGRTPVAS